MSEISKEIAKGAAWMVAFKFVDRGIGLVSTLALARLLAPSDFGLIAMAMTLIAALQTLYSFSFDVHLIRKADAGRDEFDTAWTCYVLFGFVTAAVLAAIAHVMAVFYHEPRLEAVIYTLALGCAIAGFANIGPVMFRREMRFDREFKFMFAKRMAPVMVTIPVAVWLHSYWALAFGQLTGTAVAVGLSYYMSSYRPRFSLKKRSELFGASKWLVINNLLIFLNGRAADFVIGRFSGSSGLGLYTISSEVSTLPTTELVAPINRAAFPGYSRLANDLVRLRDSFLNVISMIAVFAVPAGLGIASVADLMVPAVLGTKWMAAVPVIQILAVYGVLSALESNIGYVYLAVGRPRLITIVQTIQFVLLVALLLPATAHYGTMGAAWAFLGTALVMAPITQMMITHQLKISLYGYLVRIWRPVAAGGAMMLALKVFKGLLQSNYATQAAVMQLLVSVLCGALIYAVVLFLLWRASGRPDGAERTCLAQLERLMRRAGVAVSLV